MVIGSTRKKSVCGKYCLRYPRVLFMQWSSAQTCWNTTVFILMPVFLLNAGTTFLHIILIYRSALTVQMFPYCLNISMCSDSNILSTVTFIVISYTSSLPNFLNNLFYRLSAWSLSPRKSFLIYKVVHYLNGF